MSELDQVQEQKRGLRSWILVGSAFLLYVLTILAVRHAAFSSQPMPAEVPISISVWQEFLIAAILLVILFAIFRLVRFSGFVSAIFAAALFLGVWVYCWSIFPWEIGLLFASLMTIVQARIRRVWVHDLFVLIGSAGIAIHFAFLFTDRSLAMIFASFFIYDMVAGRPNGPVVRMASALVHRGVIPGLILPTHLHGLLTRVSSAIQQADAVFLGAGDLILPATFVARAAAFGWWQATAVMLGALGGFIVLGQRRSLKPFPAFIPVGLGAAIPYFLMLLVYR